MKYTLNGREISLRPAQAIGKGGEADVYGIGGQAVKIFKAASHPDFGGQPEMAQAATARLQLIQKKLPCFPTNLGSKVIAPVDLVYDKAGLIAGFTMPLISGAEPLLRFGKRDYREQFAPGELVADVFRDIHQTVRDLHKRSVVIGDFNDLNVLVKGREAYFIDADSYQYGGYQSVMFTLRFVDPRICRLDTKSSQLVMDMPHSDESDWYAYNALLLQSLLCVEPMGGIHRPKAGNRLKPMERLLGRVTIFSPEVQYPKPALPMKVLPDALLGYFEEVFTSDKREEFPLSLIDGLRWSTCVKCGQSFARRSCPSCSTVALAAVRARVRGKIKQTVVHTSSGRILRAEFQAGKLHFLEHTSKGFARENGSWQGNGSPLPGMRFRITGGKTLIGSGNNLLVFDEQGGVEKFNVDAPAGTPAFAANARHYYWIDQGRLQRNGIAGPELIGEVLPAQTQFWVGEKFGFGLYRAGQVGRGFVYEADGHALNDSVQLPPFAGKVVSMDCAFAEQYVWFFVATQQDPEMVHSCYVYDRAGTLVASANSTQPESDWLTSLHGNYAFGEKLLVATESGILRIGISGQYLDVESEFAHSEEFVSNATRLLAGDGGLYLVESRALSHITL